MLAPFVGSESSKEMNSYNTRSRITMDCTGAVALITGASQRVGKAIAEELARAGCSVAIHFNQSERSARDLAESIIAAGGKAITLQGDLAGQAVPSRLVHAVQDSLGGLDILVNNASVFKADSDAGYEVPHWEYTFRVNTFAPAALIDASAKLLREGRGGKVINLCDIAAERPWRSYGAYCASKAALVNITKLMARRLAPQVQVNGVAPGIIVFPEEFDEASRQKLISRVPLKRTGTPLEIAQTVRFLVEHGDYITGQIVYADGGRSIV